MSATTTGDSRAPGRPTDDDTASASAAPTSRERLGRLVDRLGVVVVVGAVVAGVALRFVQSSELWLDEALSVNIAALPLSELPDALRQDGHPPLYYALLHGWMAVVGEGDTAVRALSGIISVATLPLAWIAGRRVGGRPLAVAALVVVAVSPYAIRYGSETRMYSLVMLLVFAGWLLVDDALRRPTWPRLVALALIAGALLWTHYWSMWLLAATGVVLLWQAWRRPDPERRRRALRCALALVVGGLLFLPWLPVFLYQAANTGTPWATPERPTGAVALTFTDFGGGDFLEADLFAGVLVLLVVLGLMGRAVDGRRIELDLRTRPTVRYEGVVVALTLGLALAASYVASSTYVTRYASVFFPLVALIVAAGLALFVGRAGRTAAYGTVIFLGLVGGAYNALAAPRTQAGEIATAIEADASPGDVVITCPDQLGPAVERVLGDDLEVLAYPTLGSAERVDWVDYDERNAAADPVAIAGEVVELAGPDASIWLVSSGDYRTFEGQCEQLAGTLRSLRPGGGPVVAEDGDEFFEHAGLTRYLPTP